MKRCIQDCLEASRITFNLKRSDGHSILDFGFIMQINRLNQQIQFIIEIDRLKQILRQTLLTDGSRQENSAEHS